MGMTGSAGRPHGGHGCRPDGQRAAQPGPGGADEESMTRAFVSVVVLPSGGPEEVRACLDVLHPTLGPRDELIVVVSPADARHRRALVARPRTRVVTSDAPDPATRWAAGVA